MKIPALHSTGENWKLFRLDTFIAKTKVFKLFTFNFFLLFFNDENLKAMKIS